MFCQRNVFPEKLLFVCVEVEKKYLKKFIKKYFLEGFLSLIL